MRRVTRKTANPGSPELRQSTAGTRAGAEQTRLERFVRVGFALLALACVLGAGSVRAQTSKVPVVVHGWPRTLSVSGLAQEVVPDSVALQQLISTYLEVLRSAGFWFARVDSAVYRTGGRASTVDVYFSAGPRVLFGGLIGGDSVAELRRIRALRGHVLDEEQLRNALAGVRSSLLDGGHPFFFLEVDSVVATAGRDTVWLGVDFDPGKRVRVDRVRFHGAVQTRPTLLRRLLNVSRGEIFSQRRLLEGLSRLERLPYVREVTGWQLSALNDSLVVVDVWLVEARTNRVDGVLGYVPGRLGRPGFFTGLVDVGLGNLFGTGRKLNVFWRRRDRLSQDLSLSYAEPFLWKLPLGGEVGFVQKVQDSTYVERSWKVGLSSVAVRDWRVFGRLERRSVTPDSIWGQRFGIPRSDALAVSAGLEVDRRDDALFPARGAYFNTTVRRWRRRYSDALAEAQPGHWRTDREVDMDLEVYLPVLRRQVLALRGHVRQLQTSRREVPLSEQFRLGGARTLRGYREDQFAGTSLVWSNLEFRTLLGPRSWAYAFVDVGRIGAPGRLLWRTGYGVGVRLETRLGVLGVDYGLGQGDTFATGKVHVTLVAEF